MTVELKPETQRLVQEEIERGHFRSVDEMILQGLSAWREKHHAEVSPVKPRTSLYDILNQPPFAGSGLTIDIERQKRLSPGR